jgi:malonyl-CoA/methylmalonyl-CoA synthetase
MEFPPDRVDRARPAIVAGGHFCTYADLDLASAAIAAALLDGATDLGDARVAFHIPPSLEYVATLLGIWRAGGIAVPLALSHPAAELDYTIRDADASIVVTTDEGLPLLAPVAQQAGPRIETVHHLARATRGSLPHVEPSRRALILYTSGTTGKPKGVVTTHANIAAQIGALVDAWHWTAGDATLMTLPLHHVHGIINVVGCALYVGARCEMLARFDAEAVWARLASGEITVFTAVPTIYHRLIASWEAAPDAVRRSRSAGCRHLRLMMSGSAALPVALLQRWQEITGHVLLERYGMTELGMALSNPLAGVRKPGMVGAPLPGVSVRLVDDGGRPVPAGLPGEIEVRGPGVFLEYWRRPEATEQAFRDGWFRTGDVAVVEHDVYRLLGRQSVDIIKTGGYKVSALEIEETLRLHPAVADCAVVGLADPEWGEKVGAVLELRPGTTLRLGECQQWARSHLAPYKIPRELRCVPALPRNAMGKVVKPDVVRLFEVAS